MTDTEALAAILDDAVRSSAATPQLTANQVLTLDEAYAVQRAGIALRLARGEQVLGAKLGFTSKAKAEQMGVCDVIAGVLTSGMVIEDGGAVHLDGLIHPRIEPEVAFRLTRAIDPEDPLTDPLTAVSEVAPAMEIIDSRYRDFTFSLEDVVADNTSAAGFVIGAWRPLADLVGPDDLGNLGVMLETNGTVVETGSTAAILGHPLRAITAVVRMARRYGLALPAGSIILAGAATAAVPLPRSQGDMVAATITGLGRVTVTIDDGGSDG